jgi:integrase
MIQKYKIANGKYKYLCRIRYRGQKISKTFETHREAEKWQNNFRKQRDSGKSFYGRVSCQMFLEAYLKNAKVKGISISQQELANGFHKNQVYPYFKERNMIDVEIEEFSQFFIYLNEKQNLSKATCNRVRSYIKACFRLAIKQQLFSGLVKFDPIAGTEAFAEPKAKRKIPSKEDCHKFIVANKDSYYWPLWATLMFKGLRIGEAVALYRDAIDTKHHLMTIMRTYVEKTNSVLERTKSTRGSKSDGVRILAIPEELRKCLYSILPESGPVFLKPDGTELTPNYVRKFSLPQAYKKAGIEPFNPHCFRHAFATYYLDEGSIFDLQQELGHRDIKTTQDNYVHTTDKQRQIRAKNAERIYDIKEPSGPSVRNSDLSADELISQLTEIVTNRMSHEQKNDLSNKPVFEKEQNILKVDFLRKQKIVSGPGQ